MRISDEKLVPWLVIGSILLLTLGGIYQAYKGPSLIVELSFIVIIVGATVYLINHYMLRGSQLKRWAEMQGLQYLQTDQADAIRQRFMANPGKQYFDARNLPLRTALPLSSPLGVIIDTIRYSNRPQSVARGPLVVGQVTGRSLWFYPMHGVMFRSSLWMNKKGTFDGWCLEISTQAIPISVLVGRRFLGDYDTLDTESRSFERMYDLNVKREGIVLQLLDPVMIELIDHSNITALEFSDSSVVLYHTIFPPDKEKLNAYLYWGLKIVAQVDRNFPLGKYNK